MTREWRLALGDKVRLFIDSQPHGAGTWPDSSIVPVPSLGVSLHVVDKIGDDASGPMRWVEVSDADGPLRFVLVYSHFRREFIEQLDV